ncbi:sugar phosphate isomerase/epimerase family protein [Pseudomonas marginalis]|nr:TIM barrel protein [Pseudomonas marginalis]
MPDGLLESTMTQKFYAQDTCFYSSMGTYSFEDRCEMTKAVGYDATYLSIWEGRNWAAVQQLSSVKERYDLEVAGIYVVLNLRLGVEAEQNAGIYQMLKVAPPGSTVELAIKTAGDFARSDPAGDEPVVRWLAEALSIAQQRNIRILIYSHLLHWSEKHDDALRICERLNHPNLGIVFCGYHWYAGDGERLGATLRRALPFLKQVNLSGSRRSPLGWGQTATIETLDQGEMDNFAVMALLKRLGYDGYIGWQGWDESGDAFTKLRKSLEALRSMDERVRKFPHWARHVDHQ